jgi:hypothetical protein
VRLLGSPAMPDITNADADLHGPAGAVRHWHFAVRWAKIRANDDDAGDARGQLKGRGLVGDACRVAPTELPPTRPAVKPHELCRSISSPKVR